MNTQTMERPLMLEAPQQAPRGNVVPLPPQGGPKAYPPKIAKSLLAITRGIGAVEKHGRNTFHNYNYQKWEDVLNQISPLLAEHGLIISQSEVARSLFENDQMMSITYAFTIVNEDGDVWPDTPVWTAIARAKDQKGIPDDKAANKAHTQAHKYFLLHLFNIRTVQADDSDADEQQPAKPPRPGSAESKAMDDPHVIPGNGHSATSWTDAFIAAIERDRDHAEQWRELNRNNIDKLEKFPEEKERVVQAMAKSRTIYGQPLPATAPKPPRPGAAPAAPAIVAMPDPKENPAGWLEWLKAKYAAFETYADGEKHWNDTVQALDLTQEQLEDAMGVWTRHEDRFAP